MENPAPARNRQDVRTLRNWMGEEGRMMNDLAQRIAALEDIEEIKRLKSRYCDICDDNYNPEAITGLFVNDAVWEGTGMGAHQGHSAIRKLFEGFRDQISFAQHNVMNP